jgi:hypothetical protein
MYGDSYSTPHYCVEPRDSFWGLTATELGVDTIINCSWSGNSFDSVSHMLISNQHEYDWENDFFLVGIPPLERWTVFDNHKDTASNGVLIDPNNWNETVFEVSCHHGLINIPFVNDRSTVVFEDRSWTEVVALKHIFLLHSWLDSVNANYLIINLSKPLMSDDTWRPNEFLLPSVFNHAKNIIFKDTYISVNKGVNLPADHDVGGSHHGPAGNKYYFEKSLLPKLQQCKYI